MGREINVKTCVSLRLVVAVLITLGLSSLVIGVAASTKPEYAKMVDNAWTGAQGVIETGLNKLSRAIPDRFYTRHVKRGLKAASNALSKRKKKEALRLKVETASPPPFDTNSRCMGKEKPETTREHIWKTCLIPLADKNHDGFLDEPEVYDFMHAHLWPWERWAAPDPDKIVKDCDVKPLNGKVDLQKFLATVNNGCLGKADDICRVNGVCDREMKGYTAF